MKPIDKAAEAVYERAFGQDLPEAPIDLARAVFASIDVDDLAAVLHPGTVEPQRSRLIAAWESAGLDSDEAMNGLEALAREQAETIVEYLLLGHPGEMNG